MLGFILVFGLTSCWVQEEVVFPEGEVQGYKPTYAPDFDLSIEMLPPQDIKTPGQIYVIGDILLMNDRLSGVHIIDNSDPSSPQKIGFLKVEGSLNMAVRNGILYINQYADLVAIDVSNTADIREVDREVGILAVSGGNLVPPEQGVYFECIDESKGKVVGWEYTTIMNPKCYY